MSRFTNALILILALAVPGVMQAQTCTPPVIIQVGGTNPVCAGQPVMLDAGSDWTTYQWSPGGATTRMISDTPNATMSYTVTTTDANGCTVTSQPLTVVVSNAPATPTIQLREMSLCAGGQGEATVGGTWSSYAWTVSNGAIVGSQSAATVDYSASGNGPVGLSVTVTDANGCAATAIASVSVAGKPVVQTYPDSICAGSYGSAAVNSDGSTWQTYHWTVTNATIASWSGDSSAYVSFNSSTNGQPVTVQVAVTDSNGCAVSSDLITIPVRTIAKPTVQTYPDAICAGSYGSASINPPADGSWQTYHWTVTNGTIASWSGDSSGYVSFNSSATGQPVVVQVTATDSFGCTETSVPVTIPVRTIAKPTVQTFPDAICAGSYGSASINPPADGSWQTYHWTVTNGTIASWSGDSSGYVSFNSSTSGQAVVVQVTATDSFGCTETSVPVTIPVRTIAKPTVQTYPDALYAGSNGNASINPPAEGSWQTYHWTVTNATIASWSGDSSGYVSFTSSASGQPVTVQVTATDSYGCVATSDPVTIPVRANTTIHTDQSTVCINGYGGATIDDVPENPWTSINWAVENGTVVYGQGTTRVNFQADGSGNAVVVHVWAQNSSSSSATESSVTLPTRIPAPPVIALGAGSCPATAAVTNASDYTQFMWSADNAEITSSLYGASVTFHARQNGHVTLTVVARDSGGCESTASIGYDASGLPDITMSLPGVPYCYGVPATASVPDGGPGVTYQWTMNSGQFLGSSTTPSITFIPQADTLALSVTATNAQGCSAGGTAYILVNRPPLGDFNSVPGSVCANGTATISTYTNGVSYNWQVIDGDIVSGAGTSSITFRAHTSATVTVRLTKNGPNSCGATYERVIPVTAVDATVTASGPTTFCAGGSVVLTAPGGMLSYSWSTGATTQSITVATSGSYTVTVSNATGCSTTSAPSVVTVNTPPAPTITAGGPTAFCTGGSVTLTASAGTGYVWSNGATTQSISVSAAGSYSVTVADANGCSAASAPVTVTVTDPPPPDVITPTATTSCGGTVTLFAPSGYSYLWSTGETTRIVTVSASGSYGVVITNAGNCSRTLTPVTITISNPTATITASGPTAFCAGGSVTLTANSGSSYSWSTGATTRSINVSTAGTYTVTVNDTNNCAATSSPVSVTVDTPVANITAGGPTTFCPGGSVTLSANAGSAYAWSTSATTQAITVAASGSYSVSVTNAGGCSTTSAATSVTVNASPAVPVITADGPTTFCDSASVGLSAPVASSYLWSNGATTRSTRIYVSGDVTVTVTDANGCTSTSAPMTITVLPGPVPTVTIPTQFCAGTTAHASVAETFTSYSWSAINATITGPTNGRTVDFTASTMGSFSLFLLVTNANGCQWGHNYILDAQPAVAPAINATSQICTTDTGNANVSPTAGSTWDWSATNATITGTFNGQGQPDPHGSQIWYVPLGPGTVALTVVEHGASGCTGTATQNVTVQSPAPTDFTVSATCPSGVGSASAVLNSYIFYTWSITNGSFIGTTANHPTVSFHMSPDPANPSVITLAASNGPGSCVAPATHTVPVATMFPPAITPLGPTTFCAGGSVLLTASTASSYRWSTGATTQMIAVTASGSYTVTGTNESGCSATSSPIVVTVNPSPTASITAGGPTTFCAGGSVTLTASSGTSYLWSTGATTQAITRSASGNYSVTVTDANGCSATSSPIVVTVNPSPTASITAGGPTTFCAGGSVTLTASSGTSYLWSTGATTSSIVVSTGGSYNVTVTNANGCSATSSPTVVTVNPNPTASIIAGGPTTFCAGGSVTLFASSGTSYLWSTGATTLSIIVSGSGNYSVTVTNANGCSATSSPTVVTVNANPTASITAGGPTTFCAGGSVTLTASSGASYLWSTGATTQSIVASASNNYSVSVTNANGCSATSSPTAVTVNANPTASITAGGPTTFCAGGSVTLTASSGASYLWSTGATTQAISASSSGNYSVTVTNANGCSATSSSTVVTVNPNPTASITAGGPTTFCAGGSVTLTASSGTSYLWSTGATTPSINASTSGNYSVTVTNANGCGATSSPTVVTVNANPTASITAGGPTTFCAGGSVTLTASSGASYLWSTGATTQSIVASASGSYSVTVTNGAGCSMTTLPVAVEQSALSVSVSASATTICSGQTATLTATPSGGSLYSFQWMNGLGPIAGATSASYDASTSQDYYVVVIDAGGCSVSTVNNPVSVQVNQPPVSYIYVPPTFCSGGTYSVSAPPNGTNPVYAWSVSNGTLQSSNGNTAVIVAGTSGSVTIQLTVTGANGCSWTGSQTVPVAANPPTPVITADGATTFCADGNVTLTASSGASYLWSTGATTQSIIVSASGNYSVTVTNASGCSATSAPTTVTVNANPTASITAGGPTTFCAGGSVTLTASSGASYLWSTGATTQAITASTSGYYMVTVTNANGCSATAPALVTVNPNPTASITAGGPTTFCSGGSVTLTASSGASYLWSTGATTQAITASASGNYSVTVTNANGCSAASSPTVVTMNANPTASITADGPTTFCAGGSVTLTASSGTSYLWSTGATTQAITANASGNYTVMVTNANGCSATSSPAVVTMNANPTASITAGGPTTFCTGGSVTLTASSGASYLWSTGATTQSINVSASGNYGVTVTNANGCSAASSTTVVTVNANPTASITAGGPTTFCAGGSVTLTASSGASYLWSNGAITQSIVVTATGSYNVMVTNANSCSATSPSTAVTVNANPTATINAGGPTTFCAGGSVTLTASSGASYLWSNGAITQSIVVSATGSYNVTVTNASCSATSASTAVTVRARPTASVSGGGAVCPSGSATITAALTGTAPWSVTWSDNVTQTIATGTTASRSVNPSATTTYTITSLTDAYCSGTSSGSAVVTVKTLPTAAVSGGGTICPGGSATISAALTGTAPWSVTWSDNVTQTINSGSTATRSVSPAATTTYTVTTVSDAASCPRPGTGSATVTRNIAASITTQPANQTTTRNTNVTLAVVAAGTSPISYQWFNGNGTVVAGATSASYTTSFTKKGTNTFYVEVWNSCNATHVRSNTVTVTVN